MTKETSEGLNSVDVHSVKSYPLTSLSYLCPDTIV